MDWDIVKTHRHPEDGEYETHHRHSLKRDDPELYARLRAWMLKQQKPTR